MDNGTWIAIHNIFTVDGKEKLNGDELYTYYGLCLNELRWSKCKIVMSIETINNEIQLRKNENENKAEIEKVLRSLRDKNVIKFEDVEKNKKGSFKYNVPIVIYKHDDEHYKAQTDSYKKGFEKIYFPVFDRMANVDPIDRGKYFLVCCYVAKVKREISYNEWKSVLGYSEKQARNIIEEMNDKGIIVKNSGRHYFNDNNQIRQETNTYVVPDDVVFDTHHESEIPKYIEVEVSMGKGKSSRRQKFAVQEVKNEIFEWDAKLYYQHYYYAHKYQSDDPKTYLQYQKRRKVLERNGFDFSRFDTDYVKDMEYESRKKTDIEIQEFLDEHGHVVVCSDGYYTVDRVEHWSDVEDFIHTYGDTVFKLSTQNNDDLVGYVFTELETRKIFNQSVWDEMIDKWKRKTIPKVQVNEEERPQPSYKPREDASDISGVVSDKPIFMTLLDDEDPF